jgi:hypothetical protein
MTIACVQSKVDTVESRLNSYVDYHTYMETFNVMFDEKMQGRDVSPFERGNDSETNTREDG